MASRDAERDVAGVLVAGAVADVPGLNPATLDFVKRVARTQALIVGATAEVLRSHGLSAGEYDVLSTLRAVGEPFRLTPSSLSLRLLFTTGGVSNLVKSLEARALVQRNRDALDRRRYWVELTAQGAPLAAQVLVEATAVQTRLLEAAAEEDLRSVSQALARILPAMEPAPRGMLS